MSELETTGKEKIKVNFLHQKTYLVTVLVLAAIGLAAAFQLMMEKIELWKNPAYVPSCSFNPLFSCQGPMQSWQSGVFFGIPNPLIGIVAFTVLIVVAITAFTVTYRKWYWVLWLGGISLSYIFVWWLITQSLYDIQALCIYCMIVWTVVIPLFWVTLTTFMRTYYPTQKWVEYFYQARWALIILNYGIVALMIYVQFADFFNSLI